MFHRKTTIASHICSTFGREVTMLAQPSGQRTEGGQQKAPCSFLSSWFTIPPALIRSNASEEGQMVQQANRELPGLPEIWGNVLFFRGNPPEDWFPLVLPSNLNIFWSMVCISLALSVSLFLFLSSSHSLSHTFLSLCSPLPSVFLCCRTCLWTFLHPPPLFLYGCMALCFFRCFRWSCAVATRQQPALYAVTAGVNTGAAH